MKLDMFNLVYPAIQGMLAQPQFIPVLLPPVKQIVQVYDEEMKSWINEEELKKMYEISQKPVEQKEDANLSMSAKLELLPPEIQSQLLEKFYGIKMEQPLFVDALNPSLQEGNGEQPQGRESEMLKPLVSRGSIHPGKTDIQPSGTKGFQIE